jgi:hypothetical protein
MCAVLLPPGFNPNAVTNKYSDDDDDNNNNNNSSHNI